MWWLWPELTREKWAQVVELVAGGWIRKERARIKAWLEYLFWQWRYNAALARATRAALMPR